MYKKQLNKAETNYLSNVQETKQKLITLAVAIASIAPKAPSRWPVMDFVEFTLSYKN